jgi:aryl-alcohol dehydrogenase-like predicted oxidoreductase
MRLALGTAQFGMSYGIGNRDGQISLTTSKSMIELARASGIKTLDTAVAYGDSETRLGEIGVADFNIVSKLPPVPNYCMNVDEWVQVQVRNLLARLRMESIHGLLLHRPDQLLEEQGKELYLALQRVKSAGQVKKIGVSVYSPEQLSALIPIYLFDIIQAPLNLVDRRLHSSGWLSRLKNEGVEVHTRSAFLQGLLLMSPIAIPTRFGQWAFLWSKWSDWLAKHDKTPVEACLAYPLSLQEVDCVVVGADSVGQLSEILIASIGDANLNFPDLQCDAEDLINPARWLLS